MCTVTFIPKGHTQFVLTSNRDEAPNRETIPPDFYTIDSANMLFPKDEIAGGTWIGLSDKRRLVCVLNGGFTFHKRKLNYRMSRGVIAKNILASNVVVDLVEDYNFSDIEPFTMVIVDWALELKLYELVWDGTKKHFSELPLTPRLWSSSTLYTANMKQQRQDWFSEYLDTKALSAKSIFKFHTTTGKDLKDYGVVMDRGFVKTTSITQVEKSDNSLSMIYHDLNTNEVHETHFETPETIDE